MGLTLRHCLLLAFAWCGASVPAGCREAGAFACEDDTSCGPDGECDPASGYCIFPDESCPSGHRFGSHAGEGLAGMCMSDDAADGSGGNASSAASADGDGTGSPVCGAGNLCVPVVPEGWQGPVVALTAAEGVPDCPSHSVGPVDAGHAELAADDAACVCECEIHGDACLPVELTVYTQIGRCAVGGLPVPIGPDECTSYPKSLLPAGASFYLPPTIPMDACTATGSVSVPEPTWSSHARLCEVELREACDEGVCAPAPDPAAGAGTCIHRDGVHPCPLSGYTEGLTFYRTVADDRGCPPCDCGAPDPDDSYCRLLAFAGNDCTGAPVVDIPAHVEACIPVADIDLEKATAISGTITPPPPENCQPLEPPEPLGTASEADPFTVCCVP